MANRQSRGRQSIPIQRIENQDDLYSTFSKRRLGLYKKASEMCTECNVDIGIIIFSPTNNPYSFFSPTMESVLDRYRNPNAPRSDYMRVVDSHAYGRINEVNERRNEARVQHEAEIQRGLELDERDKTGQKLWWEEIPVEAMNKEQVKEFKDILKRTSVGIEQLKIGEGASGSGNAGPSSSNQGNN